jgi:transcriptional regulator with GAF, ATPase, and Fis domain
VVTRSDEIELATTFSTIARTLLREPTLDATLKRIVAVATGTIEGCESAGIAWIEKRSITTRAGSDEVAGLVDAIQYETGQGPCLDAIRDHHVFRVDDLSSDERWPEFSARAAAATGVRSMLCFRLYDDDGTMGSLNLYSKAADAFGLEAQALGAVIAAHASVALVNERDLSQLHEKLDSLPVIEQAKGILMSSTGCSPDEAFDLLRQESQALNRKLRDVAGDIVDEAQRR